jgi:hypothetical protein
MNLNEGSKDYRPEEAEDEIEERRDGRSYVVCRGQMVRVSVVWDEDRILRERESEGEER